MSFVKYRVKEVAADFGLQPKEISEIVGKYYEKPKSYTQVLTPEELNAVFDHITRHNQISSLEVVFAAKPKEQPKAEAPKAPAAPNAGGTKPAAPQQRPAQGGQQRPAQQSGNRPQNFQQRPAQQQPHQADTAKQAEPERKRERRVVDTSAVQVNTARFEDVDNLISERAQNFQGGKQRIGGGKGNKQQKQQQVGKKGNKSRNEEQEKMRKLQMEV
ncbi:MAG: translation initiation factor IF-2, partial [Oscillospiraceae bacterium]|nr:translation initiation factor IF-2 [Oscillospiraceae bacterium]